LHQALIELEKTRSLSVAPESGHPFLVR